ncbi:MAG: hypothetical protein FWG75_07320, partial [Cystobacterineae bacterium]|nr:hypothetical protein [Cystobacterineae bacterium]
DRFHFDMISSLGSGFAQVMHLSALPSRNPRPPRPHAKLKPVWIIKSVLSKNGLNHGHGFFELKATSKGVAFFKVGVLEFMNLEGVIKICSPKPLGLE